MYPEDLSLNDTGDAVRQLQYMLSVLSDFIPNLPPLTINGTFDIPTRDAVRAFQQYAGFPVTGAVNAAVWDAIYGQFAEVEKTVFDQQVLFPASETYQNATRLQQQTGSVLQAGDSDSQEGGTV